MPETAPADGMAALGAVVRARRRELGLRQDDLADLAGVSERFVHTVEAGKASLRMDKLIAVLAALGLRLRVERGRGAVIAGEP